MKNETTQQISHFKRCPNYKKCCKNLCPLDPELYLRTGNKDDRCRWMRDRQEKTIKGRIITVGGQVMPNALLNFVPQTNSKTLNKVSQEAYGKMFKKVDDIDKTSN